jgi:hypothetical protein
MKAERTPWFNAQLHKPVRVGWYEFRTRWGSIGEQEHWRWYWNGKKWLLNPSGFVTVELWSCDQWRGLTKEWKE